MPHTSKSADFLLAAKQAEITALQQLISHCELVLKVTDLVHELQRERGLSNTYLVSHGERFAAELEQEITRSDEAESKLDDFLATLLSQNPCQMHQVNQLYNRIAYCLHQLEFLPELRREVRAQEVDATDSSLRYISIVSSLLDLVFEAVDTSSNPDITRQLVALFNLVQAKEYCGQERAWGAIGFASGQFSKTLLARLHSAQESQERCFELFRQFASPEGQRRMQKVENSQAEQELIRMRQMVDRTNGNDNLPTTFSEVWFAVATARIDDLKDVEILLATELQVTGAAQIREAEEDLKSQRLQIQDLFDQDASQGLEDPMEAGALGVGQGTLPKSIFALVQAQSEKLQQVQEELQKAKRTLDERKLIEKAKGLLMQTKGLNEEEAYRQIRSAAMNNKTRVVDVAANIISVADMLSGSKNS